MENNIDNFKAETKRILNSMGMLPAVKYLKEHTDLPLRDAKDIVDNWKLEPTEDMILEATAVNACKEVNPVNPLAVAENILALYEAANEALSLFDNYHEVREAIGTWEVLNNAVNGALKGYFGKGTNQ